MPFSPQQGTLNTGAMSQFPMQQVQQQNQLNQQRAQQQGQNTGMNMQALIPLIMQLMGGQGGGSATSPTASALAGGGVAQNPLSLYGSQSPSMQSLMNVRGGYQGMNGPTGGMGGY